MKLGRNDPCHCGSGKKYKYCHYEEDRAREAKELQEAAAARAAEAAKQDDEPGDEKNAARAKSTAAKPHKQDGSRFLRDSSPSGHGQKSSVAGSSPRSTRGAQRGG